MNQIFVRGMDLPSKSRGVAVQMEDDFIVFINTNLCPESQHKTIKHEVEHIKQNHFYNEEPVVVNEMLACHNT